MCQIVVRPQFQYFTLKCVFLTWRRVSENVACYPKMGSSIYLSSLFKEISWCFAIKRFLTLLHIYSIWTTNTVHYTVQYSSAAAVSRHMQHNRSVVLTFPGSWGWKPTGCTCETTPPTPFLVKFGLVWPHLAEIATEAVEEGGGRDTFKKIQLSVSWMKITYCSTIYPPYIP